MLDRAAPHVGEADLDFLEIFHGGADDLASQVRCGLLQLLQHRRLDFLAAIYPAALEPILLHSRITLPKVLASFCEYLLKESSIGFETLAANIHQPSKSLHRMLSVSGNPTMTNLSAILAAIKKALHVEIKTNVVAAA